MPEMPDFQPQPGYVLKFDMITAENKKWCRKCKMFVDECSPIGRNNASLQGVDLTHQWITFAQYDLGMFKSYYVVYMFGKEIGIIKDKNTVWKMERYSIYKVYAQYKNNRIWLWIDFVSNDN